MNRKRLREVVEKVAGTFHGIAERASRGGRHDDAQRLDSKAAAAVRGAAQEREQADRLRADAMTEESNRADTENP
jgi:hypothetical protein